MHRETKNTPTTDSIIRLNSQERLQHLLTFVTFFILVVTGFMLKIPEAWILKFGETSKVVFEYRGIVHRVAGTIMILSSLAHFWYVATSKDGRSFLQGMLPVFKDARDMVQNIGYYLGTRPEPPEFDRFDYREKMEYWALVAGTIIISTTGILLWTEEYWSTFVLNLSILIHGMEAILATLAVIVWHFYTVHYKPGKFPGSRIWIDGRMSLHELKEEHPLQFARMVTEGLIDPEAAKAVENDLGKNHAHGSSESPHTLVKIFTVFSMFACLVFSAALLKLLYFPTEYANGTTTDGKLQENMFWAINNKDMTGHFHSLDKNVKVHLATPPVCVSCHGNYPHSKSPDIRSFLNMHNFFMACETCHVRLDPDGLKNHFAWFDNQTDKKVTLLEGQDGIFGARLVPVVTPEHGQKQRLDKSLNETIVKKYLTKARTLTPEEQAKAKAVLHKEISKKPIQCTECHSRNGYIDFTSIGYTQQRAESLYRTEVADMIERYMKFFLPTMFDPDLIKQQKMRELQLENRSTD